MINFSEAKNSLQIICTIYGNQFYFQNRLDGHAIAFDITRKKYTLSNINTNIFYLRKENRRDFCDRKVVENDFL